MDVRKVVIIGSGPAGHTAAIYAARAELKPLMFEGWLAGGIAAGGQLTTTTEVENFPGFPEGIMGLTLMENMRQQSVRAGAEIVTETVVSVDLSERPFKVYTDEEKTKVTYADTLIIASGATAQRMNLPGEDKYWNFGISACAVCDGAAPIFKNKPLVVIGGGDAACEEAAYLTKYASSVTMLLRSDRLRASKPMAKRVMENPKIKILFNTEAREAKSSGKLLEAIRVIDKEKNQERDLVASGLFYAIGHKPNTDFLGGQLKLDKSGYIITTPGTCETSVAGVFAAGDVQDKKWRQAVTAAGSGCMAALSVEHFLASLESEI